MLTSSRGYGDEIGRVLVIAALLAASACSDGSSEGSGGSTTTAGSELSDWMQNWVGLDDADPEVTLERGPDYEGEAVLIDQEQRTIYMDDCALADAATAEGGPYGPTDGESGFASICPS